MSERTLYLMHGSSPCRAVWMVATEIGVDLEIKTIDLMKGEQKEAWFMEINPEHCVPTLKDGDFAVWESRAIMRYLCNAYAPDSSLYPKDPKQRARVDQILDRDLGYNSKHVGAYSYPQVFRGAPAGDDTEVLEVLTKLENNTSIKDGKYICGDDLTIADFSAMTSITFMELVKFDKFKDFPKVEAWIAKMKAMPSVENCNKQFEAMKESIWAKLAPK